MIKLEKKRVIEVKFEIEDPVQIKKRNKQKKKEQKLVLLIVFIIILSIIILITYMITNKEEQRPIETQPIKRIENSKLKIVNLNSDERPIAIMLDNNIGEESHAGLQDSYINYEIIVEGGLTRIMALYKDKNVSLIGPVRSSRHYFLDYALESDSIYVHYGWSPYAEKDIKEMKVNNINGLTDTNQFWRDTTLSSPHNVFTSTEKIRSYLSTKNYSEKSNNWKLLNYSIETINLNTTNSAEALPADKISIEYSYYQSRSYTYDSENKYYLRSTNGKAHLDKETKNQLNYKNIIIEYVNNRNLDKEGRQDLTTIGTGLGYYITNGYAIPIKWTKSSRNDKTKYTYANGTEVKVNDGNTFIQIVPVNSNVTIE